MIRKRGRCPIILTLGRDTDVFELDNVETLAWLADAVKGPIVSLPGHRRMKNKGIDGIKAEPI
jgi:hypothetical protein